MKTWQTRLGDTVAVGDRVALSLLAHPDAVGLIVGDVGDGVAELELTACGSCSAGLRLHVDEGNLVLLLAKGGETKVRKDYDDYYRFVPRVNGGEDENEGGEGEGADAGKEGA